MKDRMTEGSVARRGIDVFDTDPVIFRCKFCNRRWFPRGRVRAWARCPRCGGL
jgi:hypothetical protein